MLDGGPRPFIASVLRLNRPRRVGAAVLCLVLAASLAGAGGRTASAGGRAASLASAGQPDDPRLNPVVAPPPSRITLAPGLPAVAAPAGLLTQAQARQAALVYMGQSLRRGGSLTLLAERLDDETWEFQFAVDGRQTLSVGGGAPVGQDLPEAEVRRRASSHVTLLAWSTLTLDGRTGSTISLSMQGTAPDRSRPDLEHYRGRIVTGDVQLLLRLVQPDGRLAGRYLSVLVPEGALDGPAFWQLGYGTGRLVDVWGLTDQPEQVVAYRITMADPPAQALADLAVLHGIPVFPGVQPPVLQVDGAQYRVPFQGADNISQWYAQYMTAYGWGTTSRGNPLRFSNAAGGVATVRTDQLDNDVLVTLSWQDGGRPGAGGSFFGLLTALPAPPTPSVGAGTSPGPVP